MKTAFHKTARASLTSALMLITANLSYSQEVQKTETTTTTSLGTISEFGPERLLIQTEGSPDPIGYTFSKTTTYVDENGKAVSVKILKSGLPVTVHYTQVGDNMVADRVIVRTTEASPAPVTETTETQTTTTTSLGTISEFGPARIVIKSETSPVPIRYSYSKTTRYVDETGAPVSIKTVKSGLPVTVHYRKVGDNMVATKVIVRKARVAEPSPTTETTQTTTTSLGTISEFGPERIIVRSETSPDPISYTYSKTTTYVDETGAPVSIKTVKSGLPVTVYYTQVGDTMVANKVIVRKLATAPAVPPVKPALPPVVETKKTTTTTETKEK